MKKMLLIFGLLLFAGIINAGCSSNNCVLLGTQDHEIIYPNIDVNLFNYVALNGVKINEADVNISVVRPDGTYDVENFSVSKSPKLGEWYYQKIGGYSNNGTYRVYWVSEKTTGGVPDGNFRYDTWSFTVQTKDLNNTDLNNYLSTKLDTIHTDLNSNIINNILDVNSYLSSYIGDINSHLTDYLVDINTNVNSDGYILKVNVLRNYKRNDTVIFLLEYSDYKGVPAAVDTLNVILREESGTTIVSLVTDSFQQLTSGVYKAEYNIIKPFPRGTYYVLATAEKNGVTSKATVQTRFFGSGILSVLISEIPESFIDGGIFGFSFYVKNAGGEDVLAEVEYWIEKDNEILGFQSEKVFLESDGIAGSEKQIVRNFIDFDIGSVGKAFLVARVFDPDNDEVMVTDMIPFTVIAKEEQALAEAQVLANSSFFVLNDTDGNPIIITVGLVVVIIIILLVMIKRKQT